MAIGVSRHGSQLITASGALGIAGKPKIVYGMDIISAGVAGVVTLKDNGSSGTTYIQETGTASRGVKFNYDDGFFFPDDVYVSITANVTSVLISYDEYLSG